MLNRKNFLIKQDAEIIVKILVPKYAIRAEIKKDSQGYWINVWWNCDIIAPLTNQEMLQAQGEK